jgi:formiminotetrahydrofolate cyclodeaminase
MTASEPFADLTIRAFLERLSSPEPVPGGGSASAIAASFSAGLIAMVARLSLDRPKYAAYEATHRRALVFAEQAGPRFLELADRDADAYAGYAAALKLPRETAEQQAARTDEIHAAARRAAEAPLEVVRQCVDLAAEVEAMAGRSNLNASSDVNVAALLAEAAGRGAAANVLINLPSTGDETFAGRATDELMRLLASLEDMAARARERVGAERLREPESE